MQMTLGSKIQVLRKEKGLSQEKLATEIGVSRQAVSKWELDESLPDSSKIVAISQLFDVSTDYLLGNEMASKEETATIINLPKNHQFSFIERVIKEKGYMAGYIFAGYAVALLIMTRFANYIFRSMIEPPEGFGVTMADLPFAMKAPLYVTNALSIVAILFVIGGFIFARYYKGRNKEK